MRNAHPQAAPFDVAQGRLEAATRFYLILGGSLKAKGFGDGFSLC